MRRTAKTRAISSARRKRRRPRRSTSCSAAAGSSARRCLPEVGPPPGPVAGRRNEHRPAGHRLSDADRPPLGQDGHHRRRTLPHRPGDGRSGDHGRRFRPARATCIRCWPRKAACSAGPGTPRPPSICAAWPACAPVGVLCEILDDRGERATRDQLQAIADKHNLKIISIEQLIAHRRVSEKLVSRIAQAKHAHRQVRRLHDHRLRSEVRDRSSRWCSSRASPTRPRPRSCACTPRASPATCSIRSAATAAASCKWPWR